MERLDIDMKSKLMSRKLVHNILLSIGLNPDDLRKVEVMYFDQGIPLWRALELIWAGTE